MRAHEPSNERAFNLEKADDLTLKFETGKGKRNDENYDKHLYNDVWMPYYEICTRTILNIASMIRISAMD